MKQLILIFTFFHLRVFCWVFDDNSIEDFSPSGFSRYPWDFSLLKDHLQSPVDIITSMAVKERFKPLHFTAINDKDVICVIKNSGHGVTIQVDSKNDTMKPMLFGSFLEDVYIFENLHFHWGEEDYFGSEHFINGESFSFEGHMVMFKKEYKDVNNALRFKDGVIVLTFFATDGKNNKYLDRLLKFIPQIAESNKAEVKTRSADTILWFLPDLVKANQYSDYFAYPGSLTTSPFTESVTFIILPEPISISHAQLDVLRTLKNHETEPVVTNRRELQPLRGRPLICANNIQWNIKTKNSENEYPLGFSTTGSTYGFGRTPTTTFGKISTTGFSRTPNTGFSKISTTGLQKVPLTPFSKLPSTGFGKIPSSGFSKIIPSSGLKKIISTGIGEISSNDFGKRSFTNDFNTRNYHYDTDFN